MTVRCIKMISAARTCRLWSCPSASHRHWNSLSISPATRSSAKFSKSQGWHVKEAHETAGSPADFQRYIQSSRREFGCAKPAYVKMLTSWISDRTICYLASGRPAIIQDTGPTRYCSGDEGVLRFRDLEGAIECFEAIESDYSANSAAARARAEQHFSAWRAAAAVLDRCSTQRNR